MTEQQFKDASDQIAERVETSFLTAWPTFDAWWDSFAALYLKLDDTTQEHVDWLDRESYRVFWDERWSPADIIEEETSYGTASV